MGLILLFSVQEVCEVLVLLDDVTLRYFKLNVGLLWQDEPSGCLTAVAETVHISAVCLSVTFWFRATTDEWNGMLLMRIPIILSRTKKKN
jgi:hypothetical protein